MKRIFISLAVLAAIAGCTLPTDEEGDDTGNGNEVTGTFMVSGTVHLASASGPGISDVTVTLSPTTASGSARIDTTDAAGAYSFEGIVPGTYLVSFARTGYLFEPESFRTTLTDTVTVLSPLTGFVDTGAFTAADYLPLTPGTVLNYTVTPTEGSTFAATERILDAVTKSGKSYFPLVNSHLNANPDTSFMRMEGEILYMIPGQDFSSYGIPLTEELPCFTFGLAAGTSWPMYLASEGMNSSSASCRYEGTEIVEVPAGVFRNCAKFELTVEAFVYNTTTLHSDQFIQVQTFWFAPHVGPVKVHLQRQGVTVHTSALTSRTLLP